MALDDPKLPRTTLRGEKLYAEARRMPIFGIPNAPFGCASPRHDLPRL
jgi:hypothetical protein